jgi:hypothetical protein
MQRKALSNYFSGIVLAICRAAKGIEGIATNVERKGYCKGMLRTGGKLQP